MNNIIEIAKNARNAFLKTMSLNESTKNEALKNIIKEIELRKDEIFKANKTDLENAKNLLNSGEINQATYDRLKLSEEKLRDLIQGLEDLIKLEDPNNKVIFKKQLDEGLILEKITTPIGVIGVIFEARPDCFIQISSLIIKSGNCAILKGGSECKLTNTIFSNIVVDALNKTSGFPQNVINIVHSRDDIKELLSLDEYISLIIPRGSNKLVSYIKENTKIPVLGHSSGICHIFLDKDYDFTNAKKIIIDSKKQYPSACNAVETVLVHKDFKFINDLKEALVECGIKVVENPENYSTEYGTTTLSFKIVDSVDSAIEHINNFGSNHTDSILSDNKENIEKFMNLVDSSSVFANCSTRFSDGFRYGFGAEVGISTNKTHARGPVGLEGLMIYKYKLLGNGDIVAPYANGTKSFNHKLIS